MYASLNVHLGEEPSRRDDLVSLGYMLIHFLRGNLPWETWETDESPRQLLCEKIRETMTSTTLEELCQGFPKEFLLYLQHCRKLEFDEKPKYEYLRDLFAQLLRSLGFKSSDTIDWKLPRRS